MVKYVLCAVSKIIIVIELQLMKKKKKKKKKKKTKTGIFEARLFLSGICSLAFKVSF